MKILLILFSCLCSTITSFAQEQESASTLTEQLEQKTLAIEETIKVLQRLKISGYIQTQYQWGEKEASLSVGNANTNPDESFNRFGIRRGRIKFAYEQNIVSGIFQLDVTEKGIGVKDAYFGIKAPWIGTSLLKVGIFDRPFGYEIGYSSSQRESPERSTVFQTLFPEERDLGISLTLQAAKTSPWNFLKLEAGLFAGNGIKQEIDNRKDFIGHLFATNNIGSNIKWRLGTSYYNGGVFQGNENVYKMKNHIFVADNNPNNKGQFAKREYFGVDGQFSFTSLLGLSQIRAEYLTGTQPGNVTSNKSPNAPSPASTDTYIRKFNGGYVLFVQDISHLPLSAVLKYDWYNPNTEVTGDDTGLNGTGLADLNRSTFGFGMLWYINKALRLQAYYDMNRNETSQNLSAFTHDIRDDVFTLRLQYKF